MADNDQNIQNYDMFQFLDYLHNDKTSDKKDTLDIDNLSVEEEIIQE